jgi:hypothetical protein
MIDEVRAAPVLRRGYEGSRAFFAKWIRFAVKKAAGPRRGLIPRKGKQLEVA